MKESKKILSASMMCADYGILGTEIKNLDDAGIDLFHIDIMDGTFVDNFAMSGAEMKTIQKLSNIKLDIHLMITEPHKYISEFAQYNTELISVHLESDKHIYATLMEIKNHGIKAGVAINPGTSFYLLEPLLEILDVVTVMTVNPGFAGQKFIPTSIKKVEKLRNWLDDKGYEEILIQVDGNINEITGKELSKAGANIFVLGTSSLFFEKKDYKKNVELMRSSISSIV